jgi:hypothetical protein
LSLLNVITHGEKICLTFLFYSINAAKRWDHVYRCYKMDLESRYGFVQLCFQCDEWVTGKDMWHEHCQCHLDNLEALPVQLNPFKFCNTIAVAGQCLFCLFNSNLPATKRFQQFLINHTWKKHIDGHFQELERKHVQIQQQDKCKPLPCPDPRCALSFNTVRDLQYHCQDIHCIDRIKYPVKRRRRLKQHCSVANDNKFPGVQSKGQCESSDDESTSEFCPDSSDEESQNEDFPDPLDEESQDEVFTGSLEDVVKDKLFFDSLDEVSRNELIIGTMEMNTSEDPDLIIPEGKATPEKVRPPPSACVVAENMQAISQWEPCASAASSITSEKQFSMPDLATDEVSLVTRTPASSISYDPLGMEQEYEVERILKHKVSFEDEKEVDKYKVRWAGYGKEDDLWILLEDFNGLEMVEEYHRLHPTSEPKRRKR